MKDKAFNIPKPAFWPKRNKWPPTKNRSIVEIIETLPPIFVLNDGTEIHGQWYTPKKKTTKKK